MLDSTNHSRKVVWVLVAVCALAIFTSALVVYINNQYMEQYASNETVAMAGNKNTQPAPPKVTKVTDVASSQSPNLFPKDLPMESGSQIVKNYNTSTAEGRTIGTRVFVTAKTIDENYKIYESYFKQKGWTVTAAPAVKGNTSKTMIATKDNMQAQVTIGDDPVAKAKTVAIIITQNPQ